MILVNLLDEQQKREVDPLERLRQVVALALPLFAILVALAAWPDTTTIHIRPASLEEKETVVELLGRLPTYPGLSRAADNERLEQISRSIVDEITFDRAELRVRVEPNPSVQFDDTSMTITEGFLRADPREQAKELSEAIAPHEAKARQDAADLAVRGE